MAEKNCVSWEEVAKESKRTKVTELIQEAMPYYDSEYDEDWDMDKLVDKILEICEVKDG